jgi:lipopolysaccharide transport system ATP-binding protein
MVGISTLYAARYREAWNVNGNHGDVLVSVEQLSKKFCRDLKRSVIYAGSDIFSELIGRSRRSDLRYKEFYALKDVTFSVKRGQAVGLVGANGSGKTTLLRVISGLLKPDSGRVCVLGAVAPLIALGAGFSPVLSGRENIYINMSILGMTRNQINEVYDEVVDFAEIGDALEAPVQSYSSGMLARLGFACAVHTCPELLLVDEVLSVGDMSFRIKCYRRLAQMRQMGTSFLFVSHSPTAVQSICDSAVYLSKGRVVMIDSAMEVMQRYERDLFSSKQVSTSGDMALMEKKSDLYIERISFRASDGSTMSGLKPGEPASLHVRCCGNKPLENVSLNVIVRELNAETGLMLVLESLRDGKTFSTPAAHFVFCLKMEYCGLRPGLYTAKIYLTAGPYFDVIDAVESFIFRVDASALTGVSAFYQPRSWHIEQNLND